MPFPLYKYGSVPFRGIAVCLAWLLSMAVWQSSAEATCGDYLMSRGDVHQPGIAAHDLAGRLHEFQQRSLPGGCSNGDCHSQEQAPEPVGSTVTIELWTTSVCSAGWPDWNRRIAIPLIGGHVLLTNRCLKRRSTQNSNGLRKHLQSECDRDAVRSFDYERR